MSEECQLIIFCSAREKNHKVHTQNFCHTNSNSKNNRTFAFRKCITCDREVSVLFWGAGCRDTWCLALPFTAVYFTIESVFMFVGELILRTQYLNNHGKYRHKTKQVYAGDRTLQSWSMVWVVSCMFTDQEMMFRSLLSFVCRGESQGS